MAVQYWMENSGSQSDGDLAQRVARLQQQIEALSAAMDELAGPNDALVQELAGG